MTLLFASSPSTDVAGPRVALMQGCDPRRQSRYKGSITGTLEILIMREATGEDCGYRWPSWTGTSKSAMLVQDFAIRADICIPELMPCSSLLSDFRVEFDVQGTVNSYHAAAMARTLSAIDKITATHRRSGDALPFLCYVRDVLAKLGVKRTAVYRNDRERGDLSSFSNFIEMSHSSSTLYYANEIIDKIRAN